MKKHADAMTTWEFLNEEFFKLALKGRYDREFAEVRERLTCLKPFQTGPEFMHALWNDKDLREDITGQLKALWQSDFDFRQTSGKVLLMAMWRNAVTAGDDYWGNLFIQLGEGKDGEPC